MGMDTIDIEEFANEFKNSFVSVFTEVAMTALIASQPWIAASPLRRPIHDFIEWIITLIGTVGGLVAFMINTHVFTTDQADDWFKSRQVLKNLPDDVTDEVWDKAEEEANHAFRNLINYRK